jgi:hypothetical protein
LGLPCPAMTDDVDRILDDFENRRREEAEAAQRVAEQHAKTEEDWRKVSVETVLPALREIPDKLTGRGYHSEVSQDLDFVELRVEVPPGTGSSLAMPSTRTVVKYGLQNGMVILTEAAAGGGGVNRGGHRRAVDSVTAEVVQQEATESLSALFDFD